MWVKILELIMNRLKNCGQKDPSTMARFRKDSAIFSTTSEGNKKPTTNGPLNNWSNDEHLWFGDDVTKRCCAKNYNNFFFGKKK